MYECTDVVLEGVIVLDVSLCQNLVVLVFFGVLCVLVVCPVASTEWRGTGGGQWY